MSKELLQVLLDVRRAQKLGSPAIAQRQRARLTEMVALARTQSPYYRELYRNVPEGVENSTLLPVSRKKELMARFDDWSTDREVTTEKVRAFIEDSKMVGERFLGKYTVATTSGTTGTPGIFIIDDHAMRVTRAIGFRLFRDWIGFSGLIKLLLSGGRLAMTIAPGHSASAVAAARFQKSASGRKRTLALPVHAPLQEMVSQLNEFSPALFAPYPSVAKLLAAEQEAGRLHIRPVLMSLAAEGLAPDEYDRIAEVFRTKVGNSYAATECPFLSYDCEYRWLHVNSDWVIVEPVDVDYRPTPLGEQSHTVLISNLANRVQPILRYDLGDSILQRPDPCPCGNPMPAIRVQGRAGDVLTFSTASGERVSIPPLALELDEIAGLEIFQVEQTALTNLRLRLHLAPGIDVERVWQSALGAIQRLLAEHKLDHVTAERAEEPPKQSRGGKFRTVIPLR